MATASGNCHLSATDNGFGLMEKEHYNAVEIPALADPHTAIGEQNEPKQLSCLEAAQSLRA